MKGLLFIFLFNFLKTPCLQAQASIPAVDLQQIPVVIYQETSPVSPAYDSSKPTNRKVYLVAGIHAVGYASTLTILSSAWYKNYPKTPFHIFNDSKEWLQVDKTGHMWTAYNIAHYSALLWQWSGLNPDKAAVLGGLSSLGYQTILEYLDAHSAEWGWSWADMGANTLGAALYTGQELAWGSQKVIIKFSSFPQVYNASLQPRTAALFGKTFPEQLLKDYNAQTYWASVNLESIFHGPFPRWLNLAVGYGAQGMYGGFENVAVDKNGNIVFDRSDIKRVRQWYLSPDVDWTKIKTNNKMVRTLFTLMNMIKVPAPALELRSGKIKTHWVSF